MNEFNISPLGVVRCTYVVFFDIAESKHDPFRSPRLNAAISIAFPLYLNGLTIAFILVREHYIGGWFLSLPKIVVLAIAFGILAMIHLYFSSGRRCERLVRMYRDLAGEVRRRIRIIAFSYIFVSLAIAPLVGLILQHR